MRNLKALISLLETTGLPGGLEKEEDFSGNFFNPLNEREGNDCTIYELFVGNFEREDLTLSLADGQLTVKGEASDEDEGGTSYASLNCSFVVGDDVVESDVTASFSESTLTVVVKRKPAPKVKPGIRIN